MTSHRHNVPSARDLRAHQTPAETTLWHALRGRQLAGLKFRRQHPIGPFVVDFCCPDRRLVIELDGGVHDLQRDHDAEREQLLAEAGYVIHRFTNAQIMNNLPAVLETIRITAERQPQRPAHAVSRIAGWQ